MNEKIRKHKQSNEYQNALMKFSSIIWTLGFTIFALLGFLTFFLTFKNNPEIAWGSYMFATLFTWRANGRMKMVLMSKDACIGYALGLNIEPKLLQNIKKAKQNIFKQQYKIALWTSYLSKKTQKQLKEKTLMED